MLQSGLIFLPVMKCLTYIYQITTVQKFVVSAKKMFGGVKKCILFFHKGCMNWIRSDRKEIKNT